MSTQSKADLIAKRQANLPRPEDPPVEVENKSANPNNVNTYPGEEVAQPSNAVTSERTTAGLDGTATKGSGVREAGGTDFNDIGRQ